MTWKSTAIVTGVTALVGWMASPLPHAPAPAAVTAPRPETVQSTANSDIEQQAAKLRSRLHDATIFQEPSRDPFRFGAREVVRESVALPRADVPANVEPAPVMPLITLSGIASDVVDGVTQRTAILSAPDGVTLVREGDTVAGTYRVGKIEDESVDLLRATDGQLLRLRLAGPRP